MSKLLERLDELEKAAQSAHYLDRETYEYERALWAAYPKLRAVAEAAESVVVDDHPVTWRNLRQALAALEEGEG